MQARPTMAGHACGRKTRAVTHAPSHPDLSTVALRRCQCVRGSAPRCRLPPRRSHDDRHVASRRIAGHRVGVGVHLELVLEPLGRLGRLCPLQVGEQRLDLIRVRARVSARVGVRAGVGVRARVRVGVRVWSGSGLGLGLEQRLDRVGCVLRLIEAEAGLDVAPQAPVQLGRRRLPGTRCALWLRAPRDSAQRGGW